MALLTMALFVIGGFQVRISHLTAHRQLRAYLHLEPGAITEQNPKTGFKMEARPNILNKGATPAYDVQFVATLRAINCTPQLRAPDGYDFSLPAHTGGRARGTMGPGQTHFIVALAEGILSDAELAQIKAKAVGTTRLFVFGEVTYRDAFRKRHRTKFSWILFWQQDGTVNWFAQPENQEAT